MIESNPKNRASAKMNPNREEQKPLVSVVVPAYNEEEIIEKNLRVLCQYMKSLEEQYRWELIVINDGSTDSTGDLAESLTKNIENAHVLHHMFNFRLGQALRFAFNSSRADYFTVMDIDLSYSPEHIGMMLSEIKERRAKIVIASPYAKGGRICKVPWVRKILSVWANRFLCFTAPRDMFSDKLTNITGMVRTYDGQFLRRLDLRAMDVDINYEIIFKAKILRARIVEVPACLNWKPRKSGRNLPKRRKSSLRIIRSIGQSFLFGLLFRPFMFFILPGLITLLLSLYPITRTIIHIIHHYNESAGMMMSFGSRLSEALCLVFRHSPHVFILGGMALLVAIQLISVGLLALQKQRYFEELFHLGSTIFRNIQPKEKIKTSETHSSKKTA